MYKSLVIRNIYTIFITKYKKWIYMITTKISIKPHLKEYVIGKYAGCVDSPVHFPDRTDINYTIWDLTEKRPADCPVDSGNLEIEIPSRREGKPAVTFNYLSKRSHAIIERKIETMFFSEIHETITEDKHRYGISYIESIYTFMRKYGISSISEDAIKKNYYRWKQSMLMREKRGYQRKKSLSTV